MMLAVFTRFSWLALDRMAAAYFLCGGSKHWKF